MSQSRPTASDISTKSARNRAVFRGVIMEVVADLKAPINKYSAKKTVVDGITFASKHEAKCYSELKLREKAGEISNLALQATFPLVVNGRKVCRYLADFVYWEDGRCVVADAKGYRTPVYQLKKKLMLAVHGIEIKEV